jgi:hypothetical protein
MSSGKGTPRVPPTGAGFPGERYTYLAAALAAGNTNVVVPAGYRVLCVAAWQNGSGASFTLNTVPGQTVVLPPFGAAELAPGGGLAGPITVTFAAVPAGGGGYIIDLAA